MNKNQLRAEIAVLRLALRFAQVGGDPRTFIQQPISDRDGGAWVRSRHSGNMDANDRALQDEVKALLLALVEQRPYEMDVRLRFGIKRHAGAVVVTRASAANPPDRDLFLYRLVRLLEDVGVERLRKCPECGELFLKVTRKEYCSTKCQARVNMRNFRRQQKDESVKRRESRHGKTTRKG